MSPRPEGTVIGADAAGLVAAATLARAGRRVRVHEKSDTVGQRLPATFKEVAIMTNTVIDPVCGMQIRPDGAAASEEHDGQVFFFCSEGCHRAFMADPHRYGHPEEP